MNKARHAARELFYTGECSSALSSDEEFEIQQKYGIEAPRRKRFQREVDDVIKSYEEDSEYHSHDKVNRFHPVSRSMAADIVDQIEDDFNLDINNLDPKKYHRLNNKFELVKKAAWRRVMLSKMPDPMKKHLATAIDKSKNAIELMNNLYMFVTGGSSL